MRAFKSILCIAAPSVLVLLLGCIGGGDSGGVTSRTGTFSYTNPTSGTYQLVRSTSYISQDGHLVLDLIGPSSDSGRGIGFYLNADPAKTVWGKVVSSDTSLARYSAIDPTYSSGIPIFVTKGDAATGNLQVGIFRKGAGTAIQFGPGIVLATVALDARAGATGPVSLSALSGVRTNADGTTSSITITVGSLEIR